MRPRPAHDIGSAHGARLACDLMSVSEQGKGRDTLDVELGGDALLVLGIELGEPHVGFKLCGRLLECRRHHLAWAAPWGPEVDQHGDVAAADMPLKGTGVQLQRISSKQVAMALAAIGVIGQSSGVNPVYGITVRADNMLGFSHGRYPARIGNFFPYCDRRVKYQGLSFTPSGQ